MIFPYLILPVLLLFWISFIGRTIFDPSFNYKVNYEVFLIFQFLFAFISVILMWGSVLERVRYRFLFFFSSTWLCLVYMPVAFHVLSPNGFIAKLGVYDFAGGFTVHLTSGLSALVLANCIGRRLDYFQLKNKFNQTLIFLGTILIWIGWFGFNGGSSLLLNDEGINAVIATFIAPIVSLGAWCLIDFLYTPHKISLVSLSIAIVSGLVAITPGAGSMSVVQSIIIGLAAGTTCNFSHRLMHKVFKVDDVLDVFSSHAVGGIVGSLLAGYFISSSVFYANLKACFIITIYTLVVSYSLIKLIGIFCKARVSVQDEQEGLDIKYHAESVINL